MGKKDTGTTLCVALINVLFDFQFVKFANIEEDTPSYHRRYDFFVSKFSAMCHSGANDEETQAK